MSNRKKTTMRGRPSKFPPEFRRDAVRMVLDEDRPIGDASGTSLPAAFRDGDGNAGVPLSRRLSVGGVGMPASLILTGTGSEQSGEQFSLGVHAELSVYGGQVVANRAGAQEHAAGDIGNALAGDEPGHDLALAGR
jgi:hypothetical protein